MSLLFDQNLSPRLVHLVSGIWPGCVHVRDLGLAQASDLQVIDAAVERKLAIVTKDSDFNDLVIHRLTGPKVIWVRLGNSSTDQQAQHLIQRAFDINHFLYDTQLVVLII